MCRKIIRNLYSYGAEIALQNALKYKSTYNVFSGSLKFKGGGGSG